MSGMADAIDRVAAAIVAQFPDPDTAPIVTGYPGPTDPPQRATIVLGSEKIDPPSVACPARVHTVRAWVVSAITAPGAGDNDLDLLIDSCLNGLDADRLSWDDATRGVWQDAYPCYTLSVEVTP